MSKSKPTDTLTTKPNPPEESTTTAAPLPQRAPADILLPRRRRWTMGTAFGLMLLGLLVRGAYPIYSGWAEQNDAERLCWEFARLKNAGDRQADRLLGPPPVVPDRAVSRREADRLDAEFILRQPFRITKVRRLPERGAGGAPRLKLVGKGSVRSERFLVEGDAQPSQRMLFNPDLIVEVRDGKLYGVRAQLSDD